MFSELLGFVGCIVCLPTKRIGSGRIAGARQFPGAPLHVETTWRGKLITFWISDKLLRVIHEMAKHHGQGLDGPGPKLCDPRAGPMGRYIYRHGYTQTVFQLEPSRSRPKRADPGLSRPCKKLNISPHVVSGLKGGFNRQVPAASGHIYIYI